MGREGTADRRGPELIARLAITESVTQTTIADAGAHIGADRER
jgi:hypothetical protein